MNRVLRIFRKDVRRLWPQTIVFLSLLVGATVGVPAYGANSFTMAKALLRLLEPVACWVLVISLIHEERLIGHSQYWLTRPYAWRDLVGAKALFAFAVISVPVFLCQCATLAAHGLSPFYWLTALLWRQVFFFVFYVLPAAALAAVTESLGQVFLAAVPTFLILEIGAQALRPSYSSWGGLDWIGTCGVALMVAAGLLAALIVEYTRRRTALARTIVALTLCTTFASAFAPVWGGAFAIQRAFSPERVSDAVVSVLFDDSRAGTRPLQYSTGSSDPDGVRLEIPVRVENIPGGDFVGPYGVSVSGDGPNGSWHSGWLVFPALHSLAQGKAWMTVYVDRDFYARNQDAAVQFSIALSLGLTGEQTL